MAIVGEYRSDGKGRPRSSARIETSAGTAIYLMPVESFPGHFTNVYLIDVPGHATLFDVGTEVAFGELLERFDEIRSRFGVTTRPEDLREVVVSHAHMDHFGGVARFREMGIPLAIHELDARVLEGFQERLVTASRDIGTFLTRAGLRPGKVQSMVELYRAEKTMFREIDAEHRLRNGDVIGAGWRVLHVPGHCPGLICLAVDDVVLTGDHLLARITPAQRPQQITPFMGLENYLRSLEKLRGFGAFSLGLGAHEAPIPNVAKRIDETMDHHAQRLSRIWHLCAEEPRTVEEVSRLLFGEQAGYGMMLGLSEAGAHVEYLHDLGALAIENLDDVAARFDAVARYRAKGKAPERPAPPG